MKIAVVGVGKWGTQLLRNLVKHQAVEDVYVYDLDPTRAAVAAKEYPGVKTAKDYQTILTQPSIQAVALATPAKTHFALAEQALRHDKHVLIEKPMATRLVEAKTLEAIARQSRLRIMVDHIMIYHSAIRKIKEIIEKGGLDRITFFEAMRTSRGLTQQDVDVVWDLAIHDLSIVDYLVGQRPRTVSALGFGNHGGLIDHAFITLAYDGCIGHIKVNWVMPAKIRRILIGNPDAMVVFDDTSGTSPLRIYKKVPARRPHDPRETTVAELPLDHVEPLALVVDEFVSAIKQDRDPMTNGVMGRRMVEMIAAIQASIKRHGAVMKF